MASTTGFAKCAFFIVLVNMLLHGDNAKLTVKSTKSAPNPQYRNVVNKKISKLGEMLENIKGSLPLPPKAYRELVFDSPRNHTTFVLFYNDDYLCDTCKAALTSFEKIVRAFLIHYVKFDGSKMEMKLTVPVFFVHVKISDGKIRVDADPSQPSLYYFAPSTSPKYNLFEKMGPEYWENVGEGSEAGAMTEFIQEMTGLRLPLKKSAHKPEIYSTIMSAALCMGLTAVMIYRLGLWEQLVEGLHGSNFSYLITTVVMWLLAGNMYNYINYTPFIGNYGMNFMSVIYPGMRSQFGAESIMIMMLYAVIMYSVISLVETRERQLEYNIPMPTLQAPILGALSGFYVGFMGLQYISQLKMG